MARCAFPNCKANALKNDKFCFFHSQRPEIIEKQKQARIKAGKSRKKHIDGRKIENVSDVLKILSEALNEVRNSPTENVVSKARAIGFLANVCLTALEKGTFEERLTKLEKQLA